MFSDIRELCENTAEIKIINAEAHVLGVLKLLKYLFRFFGERISKCI